ncbi:MAG: hypothetical protein AAGE01_01455 [Pseudomonadota bacterium]
MNARYAHELDRWWGTAYDAAPSTLTLQRVRVAGLATAGVALAATLAALMVNAVEPTGLPERFLEAVAFGGMLLLVGAAWRATALGEVGGLTVAAAATATLAATGHPAAALAMVAAGLGAVFVRDSRLWFVGVFAWLNLFVAAFHVLGA